MKGYVAGLPLDDWEFRCGQYSILPLLAKTKHEKTKFYHHRCAQFKCVGSIPAHMAGTRCDVGPSFFLYPSAFHDTFYQCFSPSFCCQGLPGMIVIITWYEPIPLGKYSNEPFTMSKHAKLKKTWLCDID